MSYPTDRTYSADHEWISEDEPAKVGITQFAADALDEAVYVGLPEVGDEITAGEPCGEIESTKSVSDLVAPASGIVKAVNQEAIDDPKIITDNPHDVWLYEVEVSERGSLMTGDEYETFCKEQS
ncbi:glycine cleavage system protein GcvH [Arcanobacterium haemolyticum]|nr:glycine cleavage system protein GcvH [Arcanobacterium haemolyticum]